jgi:hypothetical protein
VITVYVSIGNSDDKLSQREWSAFAMETHAEVLHCSAQVHGVWASSPTDQYQNACYCFEILENRTPALKRALGKIATQHKQDSIAWAVAETEFIEGAT